MAENAIGSGSQGEVVAGDFAHWQDVEYGSVQEQVDSHDRKNAAKDRARNIAARIFDLCAEINDAIPAIHGVDDSLQSNQKRRDERPGEMKRRWWLRGGRGGWPQIATEKETGCDDDNKRARLHRSGNELRAAAPFD